MNLRALLAGRVETEDGPFSRVAFRAMLARVAAEFEASQPKRRRGRRGRGQIEQIEPTDDFSSTWAELNR
jgi:hypothetical protein